jgi:hypothetical protein
MKLRVFYITLGFDVPADAAAFLLRQSQLARRRRWGRGRQSRDDEPETPIVLRWKEPEEARALRTPAAE